MKKSRAHFPRIKTIAYEGTGTANPLAFRHYNPDEKIDGKTMSAQMRFSNRLLARVPRDGRRSVRARDDRAAVGKRP